MSAVYIYDTTYEDYNVFPLSLSISLSMNIIHCRRDPQGCSNGYYVLGYRIYVNGNSHLSVDGPMTYDALLQCPTHTTPPRNRVLIHVRYALWHRVHLTKYDCNIMV